MPKHLVILLPVFLLFSCHKKQYQWDNADGTIALHKNYKFYNKQHVDSVFTFLYIADNDLFDYNNKYVDEKIKRINLEINDDKKAIEQFLYSLEVYQNLNRARDRKPFKLYRKHFYKNEIFKNKYECDLNGGLVVLDNLSDLDEYNFGGRVYYDTIYNKIHIYFPPSKCELIVPEELFKEVIFPNRLEELVIKSHKLGIINMYLKKIGWE